MFDNVRKANRGPLPERDLLRVFERIIDVMRQIQQEEIAPQAETGKLWRYGIGIGDKRLAVRVGPFAASLLVRIKAERQLLRENNFL